MEDRLGLFDLLLNPLQASETAEARIQTVKDLLSSWPATPFPSKDAVLPVVVVQQRVQELKSCACAELLAASMDTIKAAVNCWTLLQTNARKALLEVQKAVKDTAKREKKKEKDAENARKRDEKNKQAAEEKKRKEAAAAAGLQGGSHFWDKIFDAGDIVENVKAGTVKDLEMWCPDQMPMHFPCVDAATKMSFASKVHLFLQQYALSAEGKGGHAFLRVGVLEPKLQQAYMGLAKGSKPLRASAEMQRVCCATLVGACAGQMSFHIIDAPMIRHGLEGETSMVLMPIGPFLEAMEGLVKEQNVAKVVAKAMDMSGALLDALPFPQGLCKIIMKADDLLYVPPMFAMWERTKDRAAFAQYKWIPSPPPDVLETVEKLMAFVGWDQTEPLKKQRVILQRVMEHWKESQAAEGQGAS